MTKKEKLKKDYPFTLTLGFKTEELKDAFLGQFLDGWGEGANIVCEWVPSAADPYDFMAVKFFDGDDQEEEELEWARALDKVQDERDALCEQVEELGWETAPSSPLPMKLAGASDAAWHLERELADLAAWKACAEKLAGGLSNFLFELGDEADEQDVDALKEFYLLLKVNK